MSGHLALVGGNEWREGCTFDRELLAAAGADEVLVVPTAAAYEHPDRAVEWAREWFGGLGAKVRPLEVLRRRDAEDPAMVEAVQSARFIYIGGGSPMHLRSVLKDSPVWTALLHAWDDGAVLAASSAGAMVLCDPMVDPRGGAFTVGLGLVAGITVVPHANSWSHEKVQRTLKLAPRGTTVALLEECTALIRDPDHSWRTEGVGVAHLFRDGAEVGLADL